MDQLIDIIFANPLFLIIIIGGLFSLFKGKGQEEEKQKQEQQQKQQQQQRQQQQRQRQQTRQPTERPRPVVAKQTHAERTRTAPQEEMSVPHQLSVEEQRAEQMKQFAGNLDLEAHSGLKDRPKVADEKRQEEIQSLTSKYKHKKFKKDFENSLSSKGLINSIVMAEVLGEPRAKNPYQSVISKRKR